MGRSRITNTTMLLDSVNFNDLCWDFYVMLLKPWRFRQRFHALYTTKLTFFILICFTIQINEQYIWILKINDIIILVAYHDFCYFLNVIFYSLKLILQWIDLLKLYWYEFVDVYVKGDMPQALVNIQKTLFMDRHFLDLQ